MHAVPDEDGIGQHAQAAGLVHYARTMFSQLLDSLIFTFITFWGFLPKNEYFVIVITIYLLKMVVAAVDRPVLYLAKKIFTHQEFNKE